jgi:hypothetical protein
MRRQSRRSWDVQRARDSNAKATGGLVLSLARSREIYDAWSSSLVFNYLPKGLSRPGHTSRMRNPFPDAPAEREHCVELLGPSGRCPPIC